MGKKVLAMFLCIAICISLVPVPAQAASSRDTSFEETLASDLKALGLFKGVSDTDFDLDRAPSRLEAVIMLIRVLGKEQEAMNGDWTHPFVDVPPWADSYVGYAYQTGLTKGVSDTQFGGGTADAGTYLTLLLRALGYSDVNGVDFTWQNPYDLARYIGILPSCVDLTNFLRADVVVISYAALTATVNGTTRTLAQKLISAKVFTLADYEANYRADAIAQLGERTTVNLVELTAEEVFAKCSPAVFFVMAYDSQGDAIWSGSGFFIDSTGTAVTNYHVVDGAYALKITTSDTQEVYNVLGVCDYNEDEDWAILKINGTGFPYLNLAGSETVVGGATVYAIGSPLRLQNTISQGLISNPALDIGGAVTYIQTSAPISHGSSGGALLNTYGEVIGITSAGLDEGQNLNLAIPVSYLAGCKKTDPISLPKLLVQSSEGISSTSTTSAVNRQAMAYALLRDWIIANYNSSIGENNAQEYLEVLGSSEYSVVYDRDYEDITLIARYYTDKSVSSVYITVYPSGQTYTTSFYLYAIDDGNLIPIFSGTGSIYAPGFNENTVFSFYTYSGDNSDLADCQVLAKSMLLDAINFGSYIFYYYIPDYGMSDFGFTSI